MACAPSAASCRLQDWPCLTALSSLEFALVKRRQLMPAPRLVAGPKRSNARAATKCRPTMRCQSQELESMAKATSTLTAAPQAWCFLP